VDQHVTRPGCGPPGYLAVPDANLRRYLLWDPTGNFKATYIGVFHCLIQLKVCLVRRPGSSLQVVDLVANVLEQLRSGRDIRDFSRRRYP
jgi:hypothetical protein